MQILQLFLDKATYLIAKSIAARQGKKLTTADGYIAEAVKEKNRREDK